MWKVLISALRLNYTLDGMKSARSQKLGSTQGDGDVPIFIWT